MIGLIGGLGVGAAIHYYRELSVEHDRRGRALELSMVHAQMSRVFDHASKRDYAGLAAYLAEVLSQLRASGATIGVIPAVTPHICIDELSVISPLPVINLIDVVRAEIERRGLKRVALFGTRFVVETDMFGRLGVDVVRPQAEEIAFIHDTYTQLARTGSATQQQYDQLVATANLLCTRDGAEAIVLAGTDLTTLFHPDNTPFPHLDCAAAHVQAIMRAVDDR